MKLQELLEKIEKGEPVDWAGIARRQPIDLAAVGQRYAAEAQARSDAADQQMQATIEHAGAPIR